METRHDKYKDKGLIVLGIPSNSFNQEKKTENEVTPKGSLEEKVINLKDNLSSGNNFIYFLGTLFLAGFTPLPFKVFTITSGIIGFNIFIFFAVCLASRALRFFVVSYLSFKFGDTFSKFMEKDAAKWFLIVGLVIVAIAITIYFTIK